MEPDEEYKVNLLSTADPFRHAEFVKYCVAAQNLVVDNRELQEDSGMCCALHSG